MNVFIYVKETYRAFLGVICKSITEHMEILHMIPQCVFVVKQYRIVSLYHSLLADSGREFLKCRYDNIVL